MKVDPIFQMKRCDSCAECAGERSITHHIQSTEVSGAIQFRHGVEQIAMSLLGREPTDTQKSWLAGTRGCRSLLKHRQLLVSHAAGEMFPHLVRHGTISGGHL